ncbi:hypothetical protein QL285_023130 [Trifolium repens]|nr:hypothetical protein QL285_023130 [Trifolium repens]
MCSGRSNIGQATLLPRFGPQPREPQQGCKLQDVPGQKLQLHTGKWIRSRTIPRRRTLWRITYVAQPQLHRPHGQYPAMTWRVTRWTRTSTPP